MNQIKKSLLFSYLCVLDDKTNIKVEVTGYKSSGDKAFTCASQKNITGKNGETVVLEDVSYQIGSELPDTFQEGDNCNTSEPDDTVAIAVGVTVAVLAVVVVGGFLFKRYRDNKKRHKVY